MWILSPWEPLHVDLQGDKDIVKIAAVLDFPGGPVVKTLCS